MMNKDRTMTFSIHKDKELEIKEVLTEVYDALKEKGYNPLGGIINVNQAS